MKQKLKIDPNNPPKLSWSMGEFFPGLQTKATLPVGRFINDLADPHTRASVQKTYGYVLMACAEEQTHFLCAVWEQFYPDKAVLAGLRTIVDMGLLPDVIRPFDPGCRRLVSVAAGAAQRMLDDVKEIDA